MESGLIVIAMIAIAVLISRAHSFSVEKRIKGNVHYCETETLGHLMFMLIRELPEDHRISQEEEREVYMILEDYRKDVAQRFIESKYSKKCASMSECEFFMTSLHAFLDERCCRYELSGRPIMEYVKPINGYTKLCSLTDLGIVFYKLLLAASLYIKRTSTMSINTAYIYDALNTGELKVMTYRP